MSIGKVIKNGSVLVDNEIKQLDILIINNRIVTLSNNIDVAQLCIETSIIDADGKYVLPGMIDQHVHLIGGGGESGFASRTPEVNIAQLVKTGITTVLGLLGTDSATRHVESLYAKAKGLDQEGLSAFILTGSYAMPSPTITDSVYKDMVFIDKVIGCKLAISDHRAPHPSYEELVRLASDVRVAGMLANKPGLVVLHMGSANAPLALVNKVLDSTEIPIQHFLPTHVNRNQHLFDACIDFCQRGGHIDITTNISPEFGALNALSPANAVLMALDAGIDIEQLTLSSDGNGSTPNFDANGKLTGMGIAGFASLFSSIWQLEEADLPLVDSWRLVSSNVAKRLGLQDKGILAPGYCADLILVDKASRQLEMTIANGKVLFEKDHYCYRGFFNN